MIRVRIQIGDGEIDDTFEKWGFIYLDSDHRTSAPEKKRETTSYAEEAGEHVDPRTVDDVFNYKVKFLVECPNMNLINANSKIAAFNSAIREKIAGSDIKKCKPITFYNYYKRVKIVGIPEIIDQPTNFYRRENGRIMDCAVIELTIRVTDPLKCDFDLKLERWYRI